ncbi:MAG TPA: cupin domain-containing protein [Anaerolineales bacterium]|nr:cupin domain-containing protein [Anaerolineales bacterium]
MSVKHAKDVPANIVKAGDLATMQVLISAEEGPHFAMRRFIMEPGGGMPEHTNTVEHEQYVLRGHANIGVGQEEFEVHAGDVVFIPEGVPHWYQNIGEEDFEFLCIIPNQPDVITLVGKEC